MLGVDELLVEFVDYWVMGRILLFVLLERQASGQLQLGLFEAVNFLLFVGERGWLAGKQGLDLGQFGWFGDELLIKCEDLMFVCFEAGKFLVFWGEERLEV